MHTPIRRAPVIICSLIFWQLLAVPCLAAKGSSDRRLRIGLALSGGAARGAAHIGVLKVLEEEGIRIDCLAGTSFGAIVGGLYATGYSADQVEKIVVEDNWQEVLSNQAERSRAPLTQGRKSRQLARIGLRGFSPALPVGILRGQKLLELVNRYTIEQMLAAGYDFDRLPIRFRAVSTDLLTGRSYVFKNGRMSEALRASSALPLIFTPWPKDGMQLVDGSMSNNLPADIVREMGAEFVIAVDVTSPPPKSDEIRSPFKVYEQCLGLIMIQTVESHYQYADIVIRPDLEGYGSSSFSRMREMVRRGADSARARLPELRERLGSAKSDEPARRLAENGDPIIDSIAFATNGGSSPDGPAPAHLLRKVSSKPRDTIHPEKLAADTERLYATGLYDTVDYELVPAGDNRYRLQYHLMESSSNTIGISARYDSEYRLQALAEFTSRDLFGTSSYAIISSRFGSIGNHSASLRLVPRQLPFLFLESQLQWQKRERLEYSDHQETSRLADRRRGAQISLGMALKSRFEASAGYRFEIASSAPENERQADVTKSNLGGLRFVVRRDTLDAQEFPRAGMLLEMKGDVRSQQLGSDLNHTRWQANLERLFPLSGKTTLGLRFAGMWSRGFLPDYEKAYLGGYGDSDFSSYRLAGHDRDEVSALRFALSGVQIRRQVIARPMSFARRGFVAMEYNLAGLRDQNPLPARFRMVQGAAIGFSLDTMIGPIRLDAGVGEAGKLRMHFSLGPSF